LAGRKSDRLNAQRFNVSLTGLNELQSNFRSTKFPAAPIAGMSKQHEEKQRYDPEEPG
jgi:hypothetical protein